MKMSLERKQCVTAHEDYNSQENLKLKLFKELAVAADNEKCSTIGKWFKTLNSVNVLEPHCTLLTTVHLYAK